MMQANRTPVPMAVSSPSGGLHRHEHDGCPTTIVETNHSFEDSRAVGQGREVRAELGSAVVPSVRGQPGASVSVHSGVQPWNLPSPVMSAPEPSERNVEEQRRPSEPAEAAPRHRPGYIPAYGVVDDPPPRVLTITRPRRPPLTPLGRGRGPFKRVCVTDIPRGNPLYNIREFEFRAISGPRPDWGVGGGLVSDFEHHHHVVHLGLGRASWHGTQGLPHHFDGLSARPGAPVSRRPPRNRALRGHRAGFLGVGSGGDQGQRRQRAGHSRRLWERLWERRPELGANTYRVLGSVDISRYSAFPCHCE